MTIRNVLLAAIILITSPALAKPPGKQKPITPPEPPLKGIDIPSIGLGLWNSHNESATHAVTSAFNSGYIHFDSAAAYSNEAYVGTGLATTNLSRSGYWITSKLWNTAHRPKLVRPALEKTLSDLKTTHLDLYLMHWPVGFLPDAPAGRTIVDQDTSILDTWHAMEDLVTANLTRYIGVSNFSPRQLDQILQSCTICPFAHEFETHPYLQQQQLIDFHATKNITVIAYSPLANLNPTYNGTHSNIPSILEDPFWIDLARNHSVSVPQAVLAWGRRRGTVVIPKSVHAKYIEENFRSGGKDVKLSEEEMARVAEQDRKVRFNDPGKSWGVELFEGLDGGSTRFLEVEEL
jgi:alcohol dehydrogenase (NADP+)